MTLFFDHQEYKKRTIELAYAVSDFFDEVKVPFFLDLGTLLGYTREKDLIRHDYDFDIGMFAENWNDDFHKNIICKSNMFKKSFEPYGIDVRIVYEHFSFPVIGIKSPIRYAFVSNDDLNVKLDVYIYFLGKGSRSKSPSRIMSISKNGVGFYEMPSELIEKQKSIDFLGRKFMIPHDNEKYVQEMYGPNWRTPINNMNFKHLHFVNKNIRSFLKNRYR